MYEQLVKLIKKDRFIAAEKYLRQELEKSPSDVYLLTQMANTLWNMGKHTKALDYALKGEELDAADGLLAFTAGRILWSLNRCEESITRWDKLLQADIDMIAKKGFGKTWAKTLVNDARYYKADCLYCLNRNQEARLSLEQHINNRRRGLGSEFTIQEARYFLRILQWACDNPSVPGMEQDAGWCAPDQGDRIERRIKKLDEQKQWPELISYLKRKCREFPMEYWLKTRLSEYLYIQGNNACLRYAEEAYAIAPDDMLVVYNYACALYLNGQYWKATDALHIIQDKGLDYIAYSEHGEGMRWAKRLMKDTEDLLKEIQLHCKPIQ